MSFLLSFLTRESIQARISIFKALFSLSSNSDFLLGKHRGSCTMLQRLQMLTFFVIKLSHPHVGYEMSLKNAMRMWPDLHFFPASAASDIMQWLWNEQQLILTEGSHRHPCCHVNHVTAQIHTCGHKFRRFCPNAYIVVQMTGAGRTGHGCHWIEWPEFSEPLSIYGYFKLPKFTIASHAESTLWRQNGREKFII